MATANPTINLKKLSQKLQSLPPKEPKKPKINTLRHLVMSLFDDIANARKRGYSFSDIHELLVQQAEIELSASTLRRYWYEERQLRQAKGKRQYKSTRAQSKQASRKRARAR